MQLTPYDIARLSNNGIAYNPAFSIAGPTNIAYQNFNQTLSAVNNQTAGYSIEPQTRGSQYEKFLNTMTRETLENAMQKSNDFQKERKGITKEVAADLRAAGLDVTDKQVAKAQELAGDEAEKVLKDGDVTKYFDAKKRIDKAVKESKEPSKNDLETINDPAIRAKALSAGQRAEQAFITTLAEKLGTTTQAVTDIYGPKRLAFLHQVETGSSFVRHSRRGGLFGGILGKIFKIVGTVAAGAFLGPAGAAAVAAATSVAEGQPLGKTLLNTALASTNVLGSSVGNAAASSVGSNVVKGIANSAIRSGVSATVNGGNIFQASLVGAATGTINSSGFQTGVSNLAGGGRTGAAVAAGVSTLANSAIPAIIYGRDLNLLGSGLGAAQNSTNAYFSYTPLNT